MKEKRIQYLFGKFFKKNNPVISGEKFNQPLCLKASQYFATCRQFSSTYFFNRELIFAASKNVFLRQVFAHTCFMTINCRLQRLTLGIALQIKFKKFVFSNNIPSFYYSYFFYSALFIASILFMHLLIFIFISSLLFFIFISSLFLFILLFHHYYYLLFYFIIIFIYYFISSLLLFIILFHHYYYYLLFYFIIIIIYYFIIFIIFFIIFIKVYFVCTGVEYSA